MTIRPSRTNGCRRVSAAVISLVLSSTAGWARVTPTRSASADNKCIPGAPCFLAPRSVFPSSAIAGAEDSGLGGRLPTTWSAHTPRCASHSSRCTCRKTVWSVAAHGVVWVTPRAYAMRMPSLRPHSAIALELRAPHNIAQHARAKMAAQGWRLPRGFRKSGIIVNTSISGRGCVIIRLHRWRGLWRTWGMPGKQSPTSNTTLYRVWKPIITPIRKLNDPESGSGAWTSALSW